MNFDILPFKPKVNFLSMTKEQIKQRLTECHESENILNKELTRLDWTIKQTIKKKLKIAKKVSKNMKYRNVLINQL